MAVRNLVNRRRNADGEYHLANRAPFLGMGNYSDSATELIRTADKPLHMPHGPTLNHNITYVLAVLPRVGAAFMLQSLDSSVSGIPTCAVSSAVFCVVLDTPLCKSTGKSCKVTEPAGHHTTLCAQGNADGQRPGFSDKVRRLSCHLSCAAYRQRRVKES